MITMSNSMRVAFTSPRCLLRRMLPASHLRRVGTGDGGTVDPKEVEFFGSEVSLQEWWKEPNVLLSMNETRVPLIRDAFCPDVVDGRPLDGVSILDVGCGGGILSEAMARLGADVTGIDASKGLIEAARQHAGLDPALQRKIQYHTQTSSELASTKPESFDGVVASEVIEHVSDVKSFVGDCVRLTKPGGSIFITTINQTWAAYVLTIIMAETLGPVQSGTHQYDKFVKPERLKTIFHQNNCSIRSIRGQMYNILTNRWSWISDTSICYAVHAIKNGLSDRELNDTRAAP